jgi:hypothetical protein
VTFPILFAGSGNRRDRLAPRPWPDTATVGRVVRQGHRSPGRFPRRCSGFFCFDGQPAGSNRQSYAATTPAGICRPIG